MLSLPLPMESYVLVEVLGKQFYVSIQISSLLNLLILIDETALFQ